MTNREECKARIMNQCDYVLIYFTILRKKNCMRYNYTLIRMLKIKKKKHIKFGKDLRETESPI